MQICPSTALFVLYLQPPRNIKKKTKTNFYCENTVYNKMVIIMQNVSIALNYPDIKMELMINRKHPVLFLCGIFSRLNIKLMTLIS